MEHRKFGKLLRQLEKLTAAQAERVIAALCRRGDEDAVHQIIQQRATEARQCRHCGAMAKNGLQRYRWIASATLTIKPDASSSGVSCQAGSTAQEVATAVASITGTNVGVFEDWQAFNASRRQRNKILV